MTATHEASGAWAAWTTARRAPSCTTWWAEATSHVKRSIFMDDLKFSIATDRMKLQRLDRLGQDVGDVPLGP